MDFQLTEDQKMIHETVANFVKKELPIERMRKMRDDETGFSREVWQQMGELGWLGISFPEAVGGFGGNMVDASLILEQFGTTLVSEPYADAALVAGHALLAAGDATQHERWLSPMIAGSEVVALAHAERASRFDVGRVSLRAVKNDGGYKLTGEKVWVLAGHAADHILVSARTSGDVADASGVSLFMLDADTPGLTRQAVKTMDGRKAAMLKLDCQLEADRLVGAEGEAKAALERAMDVGAAAACSEGYGVAKVALKMTLEYLKVREQFGAKIGSFQALQHRAVEMFIETQLAKSTAIMAAIKVDATDRVERMHNVSAAKVQLAMSGRLVTQQAIQLHGGIGVTDEHDIGLYFKRMHVLNTLYGDEEHHLARYSSLPTFASVSEERQANAAQ